MIAWLFLFLRESILSVLIRQIFIYHVLHPCLHFGSVKLGTYHIACIQMGPTEIGSRKVRTIEIRTDDMCIRKVGVDHAHAREIDPIKIHAREICPRRESTPSKAQPSFPTIPIGDFVEEPPEGREPKLTIEISTLRDDAHGATSAENKRNDARSLIHGIDEIAKMHARHETLLSRKLRQGSFRDREINRKLSDRVRIGSDERLGSHR